MLKLAISCHPTYGGSGIVATELALGLAARGHEVHLVSSARPFRLEDGGGVHFHRVPVVDYPLFQYPPHDLCLANKLAELIADEGIELVHAHYAIPHAISAILAAEVVRPNPVKIATTLHGTDITLVGSHRDFFRVCRYAMLSCQGVTTVSRWLRDRTMRAFTLPVEPRVIPNFVDCTRFYAEGRRGYDRGELRIIHASNFRPVKRVLDVIRAFRRIRDRLPARLLLVGDGPERGLAEELVGELDIADYVDFLGARGGVEELHRSAHLCLLLSDYESFGLTALEAMACGVPVVATEAGGLPELVDHDVTGKLCPVGDIETVANGALEILGDRKRWETMSAAAAHHARSWYCREKVLPEYEAFYGQLPAATQAGGSRAQNR